MKKIITTIVIALSIKVSTAQLQTVYNSNFELLNNDNTLRNWGNVYLFSVWLDSAGISHYTDSIVFDNYFYAPTSDAYSGNTALELRNAWNYTTNTGIAGAVGSDEDSVFSSWSLFNLVPTYSTLFTPFKPINFGFYYKYYPVNGDSAVAQIILWDSLGNQIGEGTAIIPGPANSYTFIYTPITYSTTGDVAYYSMTISAFYSSVPGSHQPAFGTRLLVDNIIFNYASVTGINSMEKKNQINIFPNPSTGKINIHTDEVNPCPFKIYNMYGQKIKEGVLQNDLYSLELNGFESGVFTIVLEKEGKIEQQVFIVSE
jgi:hypothetical protein